MGFRAIVVDRDAEKRTHAAVRELELADLPAGEVTVAVDYSTLNYKDGLCLGPGAGLVRKYPHVPGIDFAGRVEASEDPRYRPGDPVILTGWRVGEAHWGGYAQRARVRADWLVPLPDGLTLRQAMAIGTAGLTAMLAVMALEGHGLAPGHGPVLVTGAAGGVGSVAVAVLARLGHEVAAVTGRPETEAYLRRLGATRIVPRADLAGPAERVLESETWAGCVDAVGGSVLARVTKQLKYRAAVAAVGNAGGADVPLVDHPVPPARGEPPRHRQRAAALRGPAAGLGAAGARPRPRPARDDGAAGGARRPAGARGGDPARPGAGAGRGRRQRLSVGRHHEAEAGRVPGGLEGVRGEDEIARAVAARPVAHPAGEDERRLRRHPHAGAGANEADAFGEAVEPAGGEAGRELFPVELRRRRQPAAERAGQGRVARLGRRRHLGRGFGRGLDPGERPLEAARPGRDRLALAEQRAAQRLEPGRLVAAAGTGGEVARHEQAHPRGKRTRGIVRDHSGGRMPARHRSPC